MEYLLFLQFLRENAPSFVNYLFLGISELAVTATLLLPALIYWIYDKQFGSFILLNSAGASFINQTVKNIACVYRPWVKYPELYVEKHAAKSATGYSFPSGHTTQGASIYESCAVWTRKKWIIIVCTILTLLTAFSRNWLGAHTLQDVLVAILISMTVIIVNIFVTKWISNNPDKDWIFALICIALASVVMVFLVKKDYPVDYTLEGKILVSPYDMLTDCYGAYGILFGFFGGWILERRVIKFDENGTVKRKIIRAVAGTVILLLLYAVVVPAFCKPLNNHIRKFIKMFVVYFYVMGGYPAIVKLFQKK